MGGMLQVTQHQPFSNQSSAAFGRHFPKNLYSQHRGVGERGKVWDHNWLATKILREMSFFHGSRVQENLLNLTLSSKGSGFQALNPSGMTIHALVWVFCFFFYIVGLWKGALSILLSS